MFFFHVLYLLQNKGPQQSQRGYDVILGETPFRINYHLILHSPNKAFNYNMFSWLYTSQVLVIYLKNAIPFQT